MNFITTPGQPTMPPTARASKREDRQRDHAHNPTLFWNISWENVPQDSVMASLALSHSKQVVTKLGQIQQSNEPRPSWLQTALRQTAADQIYLSALINNPRTRAQPPTHQALFGDPIIWEVALDMDAKSPPWKRANRSRSPQRTHWGDSGFFFFR